MTRPSAETIARVDALVAALDGQTMDEGFNSPATSSYEVIVVAWNRFKTAVDGIDGVIGDPFVEGAADVLLTADTLMAHDAVYKLVFWLTHVGEAIVRAH